MRAVLMAGGQGSRLLPLTSDLPKPMVPVCNVPVMQHILSLLQKHGFDEAVATLFYRPDSVRNFFGDDFEGRLSLGYSIEPTPLGTAGSVRLATRGRQDSLLVMSGDVLTDFDLGSLIEFHQSTGAVITMALTRTRTPLEFGVVLTSDDGRITGFLEKPSWGEVISDRINTGIYVLEPEAMELVPDGCAFDFSKNLFPELLRRGYPMYAMHQEGYWCDIGYPEQYRRANIEWLKATESQTRFSERISVGRGAKVDPSAKLKPPLLIGPNTVVNADACIGPNTVLGANCAIGPGVRIENSVLWHDVNIAQGTSVSGAVLCNGVSVGMNTTVGDGSVLGANSSVKDNCILRKAVRLWPGIRIQPGSKIASGAVRMDRHNRSYFTKLGLSGLANLEITPELCSKIAAAYSRDLTALIVSAAEDAVSQMIASATVSGAQSTGTQLLLAQDMPLPVLRYACRTSGSAGIKIWSAPDRPGKVLCTYLDEAGLNISDDAQRQIDRALAQDDAPKAAAENIKPVDSLNDFSADYVDAMMKDLCIPHRAPPDLRVLVQAEPGCALIAEMVLDRLGVDHISSGPDAEFSPEGLLLNDCSFGISVEQQGQTLRVLSEKHGYLNSPAVHALLGTAWPQNRPVPFPVCLPQSVGKYIESKGGRLAPVKTGPAAVLELEPFGFLFDAYAAVALMLGFLGENTISLEDFLDTMPELHQVQKKVLCPWEHKAEVMRSLAEEPDLKASLEGVEFEHEHGRVLVVPDADEATYTLFAESVSWEIADELSDVYADKIRSLISPD